MTTVYRLMNLLATLALYETEMIFQMVSVYERAVLLKTNDRRDSEGEMHLLHAELRLLSTDDKRVRLS